MGARRIGWRSLARTGRVLVLCGCATTPAVRDAAAPRAPAPEAARATSPPPPAPAAAAPTPLLAPGGVLPKGARLTARVNQSIGTREAIGPGRFADVTRAGEPFTATLPSAIIDERGRVLVPAGSALDGRVTKMTRGRPGTPAHITLAPERLRAGRLRRRLDAEVVDVEVQQMPGGETGSEILSATFAAMNIGGVAFGVPGVLIGYAFGGIGGAAATEPYTDGWISAGTPITVELRAPLVLGPRAASR